MLSHPPSAVSAVNISSSANVSRKIQLVTSTIQQKAKKSANNHFYCLPNAISTATVTYLPTLGKTMLFLCIDQFMQILTDQMDPLETPTITTRPHVLIQHLAHSVLIYRQYKIVSTTNRNLRDPFLR